MVVLSPAVFFNLYVVHDYYLAAISPALAALVGLAAAWLWSHRPQGWAPSIFVTVLVLVWTFVVVAPSWGYIRPVYDPPTDPYVAAVPEVQRTVPVGSLVVYLGADWNPTTRTTPTVPASWWDHLRTEPAFVGAASPPRRSVRVLVLARHRRAPPLVALALGGRRRPADVHRRVAPR